MSNGSQAQGFGSNDFNDLKAAVVSALSAENFFSFFPPSCEEE